jgi:hypothetical protein
MKKNPLLILLILFAMEIIFFCERIGSKGMVEEKVWRDGVDV